MPTWHWHRCRSIRCLWWHRYRRFNEVCASFVEICHDYQTWCTLHSRPIRPTTVDRRPSTDDPRRVKETGRGGRKRRRQRQKGADSRLISPNGSNWFTSIDFGQQLALLVTDFSRLVPAFPDFPLFISQLPRTFAACDKCSLWGIKLVKENSDDVWNWDGMERSGWNAKETTREIPRGK